MKSFFWTLAGARVFLLKECPTAQNRFFWGGFIIFIIGCLSGISAGYAIYSVFKSPYAAIPVGVVWALTIMVIDSLLVAGMEDNKSTWSVLLRIALAVIIAIVVARPLELKFFEKEVKEQLKKEKRELLSSETKGDNAKRTELIATLRKEKAQADSTFFYLDEKYRCYYELLTHERNGIAKELPCGSSSGRFGRGQRYDDLVNQVNELKRYVEEERKKVEGIADELKKLETENLNVANKKQRELDSLNYVIQEVTPSLLEASNALSSIEKPGATAMVWFVTLFFIILELSPVLAKLLLPADPSYVRKLAEYRRDEENLNHIDLFQKYPHMKGAFGYKLAFKRNKKNHERILEELQSLSQLNLRAAAQIEVLEEETALFKQLELENRKLAIQQVQTTQAEVMESIISMWAEELKKSVADNPAKYVKINEPSIPERSQASLQGSFDSFTSLKSLNDLLKTDLQMPSPPQAKYPENYLQNEVRDSAMTLFFSKYYSKLKGGVVKIEIGKAVTPVESIDLKGKIDVISTEKGRVVSLLLFCEGEDPITSEAKYTQLVARLAWAHEKNSATSSLGNDVVTGVLFSERFFRVFKMKYEAPRNSYTMSEVREDCFYTQAGGNVNKLKKVMLGRG